MIFAIFQWLIVISIFLFMFNRKWLKKMWRWIFGQGGNLFDFVLRTSKKILWFLWILFVKTIKLIWIIFFKLGKYLLYLIPRLFYWLGWVLLESFKFFLNAIRALFEIFKP